MQDTTQKPLPVVHMPDGRPAPFLMTHDELVAFLRIESRFPADTITRYRYAGLRAIQVGKRVLFRLDDVLAWMNQQQERNPR